MCEHVAFLPVVRLDSASSNRICPPTSGDIASTAGTFSISTPPPPGGSAFPSRQPASPVSKPLAQPPLSIEDTYAEALDLEEGPADVRARRIPSSCAPRFGKFQPNLPPNLLVLAAKRQWGLA